MISKRIGKGDVLSRQFQKHWVVKELIDTDVFAQAFPSSGFNHELSRQMWSRLWLKGSNDYTLVERVTRHNLNTNITFK